MAVANGFGKVVTSGSVFMYDTGDNFNSYKGKPGYNITGIPVAWVGNNNTSDFKTTTGTTTVNIPAIGTREVYYVDIWNTGTPNCCPSLWRYGDWGTSTGVSGNTLYTYSIIYKTNSGYTHPNFMYRYEFNGGSYITEVGVFDNAKRIDLGDGWYQAYNTFTTNASTNTLYLGMWYYQYNVYDTVYLYKASLTQGNHVFPSEQIIPPITTRSSTQGLLPIISDSSINLSNVSFDSNAQMYFDGTDDYINLDFTSGPNGTVELILKSSSYPSKIPISINSDNYSSGPNIYFDSGVICWNTGDSATNFFSNSSYPNSNYHHLVITNVNGGVATLYIDGVLIGTANGLNMTTTGANKLWIGRYHDGSYNFNGEIPITKTYNRVLSSSEVKQNYNKYKTRFNLA